MNVPPIPMGTPEVLFGAFIAWHAFKLGVAGYLYLAYGEEFVANWNATEEKGEGKDADDAGAREEDANAHAATLVRGFETGELTVSPGGTTPGLKNRRVAQLQRDGA